MLSQYVRLDTSFMHFQRIAPTIGGAYPEATLLSEMDSRWGGPFYEAIIIMLSSILENTLRHYSHVIQFSWGFRQRNNTSLFTSPVSMIFNFYSDPGMSKVLLHFKYIHSTALSLIMDNEISKIYNDHNSLKASPMWYVKHSNMPRLGIHK